MTLKIIVSKQKTRVTFLSFYTKSTTFDFPVTDKQLKYEKVRHNYILFSIIPTFFL